MDGTKQLPADGDVNYFAENINIAEKNGEVFLDTKKKVGLCTFTSRHQTTGLTYQCIGH